MIEILMALSIVLVYRIRCSFNWGVCYTEVSEVPLRCDWCECGLISGHFSSRLSICGAAWHGWVTRTGWICPHHCGKYIGFKEARGEREVNCVIRLVTSSIIIIHIWFPGRNAPLPTPKKIQKTVFYSLASYDLVITNFYRTLMKLLSTILQCLNWWKIWKVSW